MVLFSTTGRSDDKLRIIFDMCDSNEKGLISKLELQEMLTSLVEMAKTEKVLPEDVAKLIDSMFQTSGFEDKEVSGLALSFTFYADICEWSTSICSHV